MATQAQETRELYFQERGVRDVPFSTEHRLNAAWSLTDLQVPDFEACVMLFDPEEDRNHTGWLSFMGWIYNADSDHNRFYDPHKARQFHLAASRAEHQSIGLNDRHKLFLERYKKIRSKIIGDHQSKELYMASAGHAYPEDQQQFRTLGNKLLEDVRANIEPLLILLDPTDGSISKERRIKRYLSLSCILADYSHSYADINMANVALKAALSWDGAKTNDIPYDWYRGSSIGAAYDEFTTGSDADEPLAVFRGDQGYVHSFIHALAKLEAMQKSILEQHKVPDVRAYFSKKFDVSEVDFSRADHRMAVFQHAEKAKDGEAAIMAVDVKEDFWHPEMIRDVGFFLQWADSGVYEAQISEDLFRFGAVHFAEDKRPGAVMSAFRLGHHYWGGKTGRVDHNAAVFWFDVALKMGHGVAPKFMYQILASEDERFGDPNEPEFNAYMDDLMRKADEMGFACSAEWLNKRQAFGYGEYNDQERVMKGYEDVMTGDFNTPTHLDSLGAYAMRHVLFGTVSRPYADIVGKIQKMVKEHGYQGYYIKALDLPLDRLDKVKQRLDSSNEYSFYFRQIADRVRDFYGQKISPEKFSSFVDDILRTGHVEQRKAGRDALLVANQLAGMEGWYIGRHIFQAFEKVHAACLELDEVEMKRSAMLMGPFYNAVDPDNALPILGEYLPASESYEEVEFQRVTLGAYAPQPGIVSIESITGEQNGSITMNFETDDAAPAMILQEDIDVAMALAFGDPKQAIWPSLSIESEHPQHLSDEYKYFSVKVWNPSWLGQTDFGRTLYIVDLLTGELTWNPKHFSVAKPEDSFDPDFPGYIKNFLGDLRFTGGADKASHGKMINVSPEYIPITIQKQRSQSGGELWHLPLPIKKMRINGAYTQEKDGKDIRNIARNDTTFAQGRLTQRLTDHYDDIAAMMPVFERARQLSAMTYGLIGLRDSGFKLGGEFQHRVSQTYKYFQGLPPLTRAQAVMRQQPFKLDYIKSH